MLLTMEKILCPVDLSPNSDAVLDYALALAATYKAKLIVCYCAVEPHGTTSEAGGQAVCEVLEELYEKALAQYTSTNELLPLDHEIVVTEGADIGEAITREAAMRQVDLIVMRSRRRPRRAALLGSTAESICRTAPCPVLITHPQEREWRVSTINGQINLARVLVAYDFSGEAELALRYGLSLAQEYQSELHLLNVIPEPAIGSPELAWTGASTEGAYHKAARGLQRAVPGEAFLWCKVKQAVRCGKAYQEILSYAKENEIDLICMGAHGTGFGMQALFGSNVDRVLRQAPCPVLVARPLKPTNTTLFGADE